MARNKYLFPGILLSVFLISASSAVTEQEFEISKKLSGINHGPRMAVNTQTGDVLVTWSRLPKGSATDYSIYMAFCKRNGNGTFKVSKAKQVSAKNHTCELADVAYNPEDNSYLVVWSAQLSSGDSELFVRKINASGKAKGSALNITNNTSYGDQSPVISYSSASGAASPAGKGGYIVVWSSYTRVGGDLPIGGLYSLLLDQDGQATGSPLQVKKFDKFEDSYTDNILMKTDDGNFVLATLFLAQPDPYIKQPLLLKIKNNGAFIRETVLDQKSGSSFAAVNLSKKLLFCFWRTENFTGYQGVRARNIKALKKHPVSGVESGSYKNEIVTFNSDPGAYHIFNVHSELYGQYISSRGKLVGKPEFLTRSLENFYDVVAAGLPGSNEILVVCYVSNDIRNVGIIRGYVIDPLQ